LEKGYLVAERKPRSGTILDFGFKKENNVNALIISEQSRKPYFEVFGQALLRSKIAGVLKNSTAE